MTRMFRWLTAAARDRKSPAHRSARRPRVETLEGRELLSWQSVPKTLIWSSSANVSFNSNGRDGTATISRNEVDVYRFVAPRSGTYTLSAGRLGGSRIDTLAGVYSASGRLVAGNNDSNGTTDSKFTAYLSGGTQYALAVTNRTGGSNGGYRWGITGPELSKILNNNAGSGITSFGQATLSGNTLTLYLSGSNQSNFYYYDHRLEVYLLDASNKPLHEGNWSVSFRTGGSFVPGLPMTDTMTRSFDVSGFDLRNLRTLRAVLT